MSLELYIIEVTRMVNKVLENLIKIETFIEDLRDYSLFDDDIVTGLMARHLMAIHTHLSFGQKATKILDEIRNADVIDEYWTLLCSAKEENKFSPFEDMILSEIAYHIYVLRDRLRTNGVMIG